MKENAILNTILKSKNQLPSIQMIQCEFLKNSPLNQRTRYFQTVEKVFTQVSSADTQSTWAMTSIEKDFDVINKICNELTLLTQQRVQCNAYYTPAGSQGLPAHYDLHDVVIYQQEGNKHWKTWEKFRKNVSLQTLIEDEMHNIPTWTQQTKPRSASLSCGNFLFLEKGVIHEGVTENNHSLHFTFGFYND